VKRRDPGGTGGVEVTRKSLDSYCANCKIMHLMTGNTAMNEGLRARKKDEKADCSINHRRI